MFPIKPSDNESMEAPGAPDEAEYPTHSERHALQSISKAHVTKMNPKAMKMLHAKIHKKYPHMDMPVMTQFPTPAPPLTPPQPPMPGM